MNKSPSKKTDFEALKKKRKSNSDLKKMLQKAMQKSSSSQESPLISKASMGDDV